MLQCFHLGTAHLPCSTLFRCAPTECPWLGGQIGTAYSKGFQTGKGEDGGKFLLGVITLKHWAGYTVEEDRSGYNSIITPFDLQDSYLPAFRAAVREGKAAGVMCSYNALNSVPTCADTRLTEILRGTWKFDGYLLRQRIFWAVICFHCTLLFSQL